MAPQPANFSNHLIHEKSPYLLQHAHNPVDWYPWGKEAFEKAKSEDKPIFLSIGYATCHWCHVMEKESFDDVDIARKMNEAFVNIKVDREELPEVDSLYMEFAQALMSAPGGWPLNLILTPDLKPFFAVTYLPPKTRRGMIGMEQFIEHIQKIWSSADREEILAQANHLVEIFQKGIQEKSTEMPTEQSILRGMQVLFDTADTVYGGIKGEPKFPLGYQAVFLLELARQRGESRALFYVNLTLEMMARGGICDQIGGGFSRYAMDEKWIIPHFEKMLYDNAILAKTYLNAWQFTKNESFRKVAEATLQYVLREMSHPDGGFYSAEDADSEGQEGKFYTWTAQEIEEVLGKEDAKLFSLFYGVTHEGNYEGRNILHLALGVEEFAEMRSLPADKLSEKLARDRELLFKRREERVKPFKDDKILCSWNGMMIDALVSAYFAFQNRAYLEAALKAVDFIKTRLWKEWQLFRRYRDGDARFPAGLDDHASLIKALISLFEAGCGTQYLQWAMELTKNVQIHFKAVEGAFYSTSEREDLLIRRSEFYDGAEPSGNAVHTENLIRLYQITQDEHYLKEAEDVFKTVKTYIETFPPGACYHLIALNRYFDVKAPTIVIALDEKKSLQPEIIAAMGAQFCPHATLLWREKEDARFAQLLPAMADKVPIDGQTTVYICRQDRCEPPLVVKEEILKALQNL